MDSELLEFVRGRIVSSPPTARVARFVVAACRGEDSLRAALAGGEDVATTASAPPVASAEEPAWLTRLTVEGFRGIGPAITLDLEPGPGLVLITGRNGSGKSSLSEALETALRGTFRRWDDGTVDSKRAWRNLHGNSPRVEVEMLREGRRSVVTRGWRGDGGLDKSVCAGPVPFTDAEVAVWCPFLAYSDLGALFSGRPSDLHDELSRILGLGSLAEAQDRLRRQHTSRTKALDAAESEASSLLERLEDVADPRAERVRTALRADPWDLDAIDAVVAEPTGGSDPDARRDQAIRDWSSPGEPLGEVARRLRELAETRSGLEREMAGRARKLAHLLGEALAWPVDASGTCPVCRTPGVLGDPWKAEAMARLTEATSDAKVLEEVLQHLTTALDRARAAFVRPAAVSDADLTELGALPGWVTWAAGRDLDDPLALARHLEEHGDSFIAWLEPLRGGAITRLDAAESTWRPMHTAVAAWLEAARTAVAETEPVGDLVIAEKWLGEAEEEIRAERFEPIAKQARSIWQTLRQESSVELVSVKLESRRQRRKVDLDVRIDDEEAPALGVMSQGELMSLALGLFIPRMAAEESPFGFVVIDDPVQSMDPHKVDGLALVLGELARARQVIVLTHDTRLRDSLVRLAITHRAWRVERGPRSVVSIGELDHPIEQPLTDAARVLADRKALGDVVVRGVVPGFCRESLEVALATMVRRRRLGRGDGHVAVEEAIRKAKGSRSLAALALFDSVRSREEVEPELVRIGGPDAAGVYAATAQGSHEETSEDLDALVRKTRKLARKLVEIGL